MGNSNHFKKAVRRHMAETGMSYQAAVQNLRNLLAQGGTLPPLKPPSRK